MSARLASAPAAASSGPASAARLEAADADDVAAAPAAAADSGSFAAAKAAAPGARAASASCNPAPCRSHSCCTDCCSGACCTGSSSSAVSAGQQKCRKARILPKVALKPASPAGQATRARLRTGTGHCCLPVWAACCGLTVSKHRLHFQPSAIGTRTCVAAAAVHSAPLQGFLASSLALQVSPAVRLHLVQVQVPGIRPLIGGTVPGMGQGPAGRRSWMPSSGAASAKTVSMATALVGKSRAFAWKSSSADMVGSSTAAEAAVPPTAAGTCCAAASAGRFHLKPFGLNRLGRAGGCRDLSLTAPPSAVRVRA